MNRLLETLVRVLVAVAEDSTIRDFEAVYCEIEDPLTPESNPLWQYLSEGTRDKMRIGYDRAQTRKQER